MKQKSSNNPVRLDSINEYYFDPILDKIYESLKKNSEGANNYGFDDYICKSYF